MYRYLIPTRILYAIGIGLLIFSLVFGWVAFSVPDWLQFYENNALKNQTISLRDNLNDLKKFGLWYKCIFAVETNDFTCTLWNNDAPSIEFIFIRISMLYVCVRRFCSSCSSFNSNWISTCMFITSHCLYGFYLYTRFYYYCTFCGSICLSKL